MGTTQDERNKVNTVAKLVYGTTLCLPAELFAQTHGSHVQPSIADTTYVSRLKEAIQSLNNLEDKIYIYNTLLWRNIKTVILMEVAPGLLKLTPSYSQRSSFRTEPEYSHILIHTKPALQKSLGPVKALF